MRRSGVTESRSYERSVIGGEPLFDASAEACHFIEQFLRVAVAYHARRLTDEVVVHLSAGVGIGLAWLVLYA